MLKKSDVDRLRYDPAGPAQQIIFDQDVSGFGCRVYPTGKKSFVLAYRNNAGRSRMMVLGAYGSLTVQKARERARREIVRIRDGADPLEERRERRDVVKLKDVCEDYIEKNRARLKPKTIGTYERLVNPKSKAARRRLRHMTRLGARPVKDITVRDVSRLHYYLRATPAAANRTIDHLSAVLHWAESQGYRQANSNPCTAVKRYPEKGRERFLTVAEVAALGDALTRALTEGLPSAPQHVRRSTNAAKWKHRPKEWEKPIPASLYAVACIRFLLLSGWRKGEAQSLAWADIDWERGAATLPDSKTGRSYRPLGAPAMALLADLPRIEGNPYVFAGERENDHIRDIKRVWGAARHAAGLDDVRLHDLRHTVASFSAASGHSLHITGKLLGHKRASTTEKYAHLHDDVRHAAADTVSTAIAAALAGTAKPTDNVVELHANVS